MNELEEKINNLEEKNHRSLKMIAQGEEKFESMLNIGKNPRVI